jgi:hypothetical protein
MRPFAKSFLKLLGIEKRVEQVCHDKKSGDQTDKIFQFHIPLLKTITPDDIPPRDCKEGYCDHDED